MHKYIAVPLTCALAMMALTGCTDPSTLYENNDLVAQGTTSYKAAEWSQSSLTDEGTIDYAAGAVSLTGAKEAFSFTMHADSANLDVYDTITCDTGVCKILIVDTDTKSVAAEYTETAYDTIKLNGGNYTVYLVGKDDASFTATLSLYSLGGASHGPLMRIQRQTPANDTFHFQENHRTSAFFRKSCCGNVRIADNTSMRTKRAPLRYNFRRAALFVKIHACISYTSLSQRRVLCTTNPRKA